LFELRNKVDLIEIGNLFLMISKQRVIAL